MTQPYFVVIGASGRDGLDDIKKLLQALPQPLAAVVMVTLHRPRDRISHLQSVLARGCSMVVIVAADAEELAPGICYIGEPDAHLTLMARNQAHLVSGTREQLRNTSVDVLFHSVAHHAGRRAIGVILSGALDDGSRGLASIHAAGGRTMVLEPGSKPRGMQQNAIDYDGPISLIGSSKQIAAEIGRIVADGHCSAS